MTPPPGTISALFHRHGVQDECIVVLSGELTLIYDEGETILGAGMFAGFPKNVSAHQLIYRSGKEATYLEIGDSCSGDSVSYPRDDLVAARTEIGWIFTRKDGAPY